MESVLRLGVRHALHSVGGDIALAFLLADGGRLTLRAVRHRYPGCGPGVFPLGATRSLRVDECLAGAVVAAGRTLRLNAISPREMSHRPAPDDHEARDRSGLRSAVGVPLRAAGSVLGALVLGASGPGTRYSSADEHFLRELGNLLALAVAGARWQGETGMLAGLQRLEQMIAASADLRETLRVVVDLAQQHLEADAAAVLLLDDRRQHLVHGASAGFRSSAISRTDIAMSRSQIGRAARAEVAHIADLRTDPGFLRGQLPVGEDFVSGYGVRLVSKGQLLGTLEVHQRCFKGADPAWLALFRMLARETVTAIVQALPLHMRRNGSAPTILSATQRAILEQLPAGKPDAVIAGQVGLSVHTVKYHLKEIYRKLGVRNRTEAAAFAATAEVGSRAPARGMGSSLPW